MAWSGDAGGGASTVPAGRWRQRLALALDVDDPDEAVGLARRLSRYFGVAKVGMELWAAAGPAVLDRLGAEGFEVFADLKLHDIPTTVGRAARVIARHEPRYLTVHAAGGEAMLAAAVEGLAAGTPSGADPPVAVAVTVLTSDPEAPEYLLEARAALAARAGCGGVVCAAADLPVVRRAAPGLVTVVPGIRPRGVGPHDQARASAPAEAVAAGAGLLVVGRAVTAAADPERAAAELLASLPA